MRFLRIKIDVATTGLPEAHRNPVRDHLRDLYCTLPIRRLWLYLKTQRVMALQPAETYNGTLDPNAFSDGPEDVIVKGARHSPTQNLRSTNECSQTHRAPSMPWIANALPRSLRHPAQKISTTHAVLGLRAQRCWRRTTQNNQVFDIYSW
jgi:hypothetical protein